MRSAGSPSGWACARATGWCSPPCTAADAPQRRAVVVEREDEPDPLRPPLAAIRATTSARHAAAIARVLREEHLLHGVGWSRLAVVVRSGAQIPELARALARAE